MRKLTAKYGITGAGVFRMIILISLSAIFLTVTGCSEDKTCNVTGPETECDHDCGKSCRREPGELPCCCRAAIGDD